MQKGLQRTLLLTFQKDYKHGCYSTVFKVDYKILTSFIHTMLDTVHFGPTDTHTLAGLHLDRRLSALNVHLFESSLNFVQQELFYAPDWEAWPLNFWEVSISMETVSMVTGHLLVTDNGLTKGTIGHVSVLAWVPGCLAGSFGLFIFFNVRK